jgi:DNA-binding response OmpR family regulator
MAGKTPTILVVDSDRDERAVIAAVLREAGFAVVAATENRGAGAVMERERFAASVIALPDDDPANGEGVEFLRQARCRQPGLQALLVIEPGAMLFVDADDATLLTRPFEPRQLLGCVFELVLRADAEGTTPRHSHAAEFGIAAAKLACLDARRTAAVAAGASRLAHELTRQIGHTRAMHRGLAAAMNIAGCAVIGCPAR